MSSGRVELDLSRVPFWAYYTAVVLAGTAVAARGLLGVDADTLGPRPVLTVLLVVLVVCGELRPITWLVRTRSTFVTPTWAFIAALLYVTTGLAAAGLTAIASALGDFAQEQRLRNVLFNAAMLALSVAAGIGVLDLLGERTTVSGGADLSWRWAAASALALAVIYIVNGLLLNLVVALDEGTPLLTIIRRDFTLNLSTDGALLTLGPVLAVAGLASELLLVPVVLVWYLLFDTGALAARREHEATHDTLTGLPNRRLLLDALQDAAERRSPRSKGVLAVAIIDLDGFKAINDAFGHDFGDVVLREIAGRLLAVQGDGVVVGRLGGDEFALVLEGLEDLEAVREVALRVASSLAEPVTTQGLPLTVGCSVGIAVSEDGDEPAGASTLLRRADVAMYSAKAAGTTVVVFGHDVMDEHLPGHLALVGQLDQAISAGELSLVYQPITNVAAGRTERLEALVRWDHPVLGQIGPDTFVPLAERSDLIGPLTTAVIDRALSDCAGWMRMGHPVGVAINVSARVLQDRRFTRKLAAATVRWGVPASAITLEITESTVLLDAVRATAVLGELQQMGVRVSVDDFGTGASSLASLRDWPVDELKIDRRFVGSMLADGDDEIFVRTVVALAGEMGLATVAKGAETPAITARLLQIGCGTIQGFDLARPMPAADVGPWLDRRRSTAVVAGSPS